MAMNRRTFTQRLFAASFAWLAVGWSGLKTQARQFPGRLRRLRDTRWKEEGKWLG